MQGQMGQDGHSVLRRQLGQGPAGQGKRRMHDELGDLAQPALFSLDAKQPRSRPVRAVNARSGPVRSATLSAKMFATALPRRAIRF